jgi:hypothetical protein
MLRACYVSWLHQDWSGTSVLIYYDTQSTKHIEVELQCWYTIMHGQQNILKWYFSTDILWCTVNKTYWSGTSVLIYYNAWSTKHTEVVLQYWYTMMHGQQNILKWYFSTDILWCTVNKTYWSGTSVLIYYDIQSTKHWSGTSVPIYYDACSKKHIEVELQYWYTMMHG